MNGLEDLGLLTETTDTKNKIETPLEQLKKLKDTDKVNVIINTKRDLDKGVQFIGVGKRNVEFKTGEKVALPVWAIKFIMDKDSCYIVTHKKTGDKNRPYKMVHEHKYTIEFV